MDEGARQMGGPHPNVGGVCKRGRQLGGSTTRRKGLNDNDQPHTKTSTFQNRYNTETVQRTILGGKEAHTSQPDPQRGHRHLTWDDISGRSSDFCQTIPT